MGWGRWIVCNVGRQPPSASCPLISSCSPCPNWTTAKVISRWAKHSPTPPVVLSAMTKDLSSRLWRSVRRLGVNTNYPLSPCKHRTHPGSGRAPLWWPTGTERSKRWRRSALLQTESACRSGRPCFLGLAAPKARGVHFQSDSAACTYAVITLPTSNFDFFHAN